MLFNGDKDTNFESNSQPSAPNCRNTSRCLTATKILILKAIHNYAVNIRNKRGVV